MVGLIDVAPAVESVSVGSQTVEVCGISAAGIAHLLARFPELRMLMSGKTVETDRLMELGGEVVAAIIAAGCGYPGDTKAEAIASQLAVDTQADLLAAILRLTMPKGVGPFVEKLTALGGILDVDVPSSTAPAMKSRKRSMNSSAPTTQTQSVGQ